MPKKVVTTTTLEFAFFQRLWDFYTANRRAIRSHYPELTRKYLDFNNPEQNPKAYLRTPQFEALEMYVFLKEYLSNAKVEVIFQDWFERKGRFDSKAEGGVTNKSGQAMLFDAPAQTDYKALFDKMRRNSRIYANYIFALTMGTGKTILMATCIFYEFILANKYPKDARYCHNAIVFAPDKTVLQSLREIESFDLTRVVPTEYVGFLTSHLSFFYLEQAGSSLDTLDQSRFNIVVSNTQKIILKRQHKERGPLEKLFAAAPDKPSSAIPDVYAAAADLYDDAPEDEAELTTNQRFQKLCRLEQLGVYVDEAHHAFGKTLAKDMGIGATETDTSLRTTIDHLAAELTRAGTRVVACYNYTGTPYVGRDVLPEVVYAYSLGDAIDNGYLKRVSIETYSTNVKTNDFVRFAIKHFVTQTKDLKPEALMPKLAFFASTLDEVRTQLKPAVEEVLIELGIPTDRILVNVGDDAQTTNDDIRDFNRLDTPDSTKQFILLVNKGREGWNCRSLFGVAMYRKPKSKVFVLQASMRCLRAIGDRRVGDVQYTGYIYLSEENKEILNDELEQNFRISADELEQRASDKEIVRVHVTQPPVKIKLKRVRKVVTMKEKVLTPGVELGIDPANPTQWQALTERYRVLHSTQTGIDAADAARAKATGQEDLTTQIERTQFSELMLIAEIARYLNRSPLEIETLLDSTKEGLATTLAAVNQFNELLYDVVIPRLFRELYVFEETTRTEEHEVELIKQPPLDTGYYQVTAAKDKIIRQANASAANQTRSFHLDAYCFDSVPEKVLFEDLLRSNQVDKIYFTGMLTHGQSDFYIQYIDPESHTVRSYYPDFLVLLTDGTWLIVEVKRDDQIDDPVVQAKKDYARQVADASAMEYRIIKGTDAQKHGYAALFDQALQTTPMPLAPA